jgi:hypothetical protein
MVIGKIGKLKREGVVIWLNPLLINILFKIRTISEIIKNDKPNIL